VPGLQGFWMTADGIPDGKQAAALLALVQQHAPAVLAVCLVYLRNLDEAEDLVQDTLLKATANIGKLRDPQAMQAWVLQIARRLCINHLNRKKSMEPLPAEEIPAPVEANDSDVERLRGAVARLPKDYRDAIRLHYLEGKSCATVGQILDISEGAVRVRLVRARSMLHERLKETEG
jgi:RNA polymerase sigma factor (sigma-70 family)